MSILDTRLQKEYNRRKLDITIQEPRVWIAEKTLNGERVVLYLDFRGHVTETNPSGQALYPFQPPLVKVLSPFVFLPDVYSNWGPTRKVEDIFETVASMIEIMRQRPPAKAPSPSLQSAIDVAKSTAPPLWLVLGSSPGEDADGRTFYDRPNIFFLDKSPGRGPNKNRLFEVDFTRPDEMAPLCEQLPNKFQKMCFDYSVTKFFTPTYSIESQRDIYYVLKCLYEMLEENGVLYIASPGARRGGAAYTRIIRNSKTGRQSTEFYNPVHPGYIFTEVVNSVGFRTEVKNYDEIDDPLVQVVHKERRHPYRETVFLVCTKGMGGGKRKARRSTKRRKVNRKQTRKTK